MPINGKGLEIELQKRASKLVTLAKEKEGQITREEISTVLGPDIAVRFEDWSPLHTSLELIGDPKLGKQERKQLKKYATRLIATQAMIRVSAIHSRGWKQRLYLLNLLPHLYKDEVNSEGVKEAINAQLQMVGRGENKVGYLEQLKEVIERVTARKYDGSEVQKYGWPADLVLQTRPGQPAEVYLVEVEPHGLNRIARKIRIVQNVLENQFNLAQILTRIPPKKRREIASQFPRAKTQTIAFYCGKLPFVDEVTALCRRVAGEHRTNPSKRSVNNKIGAAYRDFISAYHNSEPVELHLNSILKQKYAREWIAKAKHDVVWLLPVEEFVGGKATTKLYSIDLKRALAQREQLISKRDVALVNFGKKNRVSVEKTQKEVVDFQKMKAAGVARELGYTNPAINFEILRQK